MLDKISKQTPQQHNKTQWSIVIQIRANAVEFGKKLGEISGIKSNISGKEV